jgi:hypothetical protein
MATYIVSVDPASMRDITALAVRVGGHIVDSFMIELDYERDRQKQLMKRTAESILEEMTRFTARSMVADFLEKIPPPPHRPEMQPVYREPAMRRSQVAIGRHPCAPLPRRSC